MTNRDSSSRVLFISHEVIGAAMAGPGIRYYRLAETLARHMHVVLAIPQDSPPLTPLTRAHAFDIARYLRADWRTVEPLVNAADVVILPADIANNFPSLVESSACFVVDGYDPLLSEWLALDNSTNPEMQYESWTRRMQQLQPQYLAGDFFICASERQRDWWIGLLEANGRINPFTYRLDPSLRQLIDVVPFGLPGKPPVHTRQVIRESWQGIGLHDRVILWGGGLWPWLDPLTAIHALAEIWRTRDDVRLIFPGTRHPNPQLANMPTQFEAARNLACDYSLLGKGVFFGDWIPYEDWQNVLLESDVALSLHFDTLETRLAYRSRMLDYIWAGLPIVATKGDATSDLVSQFGLGEVVDFQDVEGVARALLRLLSAPSALRDELSHKFTQARETLTWVHAARPLVEFCRNPRRAPDRVAALDGVGLGLGNPHYQRLLEEASAEREQLRVLIRAYEQGRFIRLMRWLKQRTLAPPD